MNRATGTALTAVFALALVGCGGTTSALEQTARNLDDIRTGELMLAAALEPSGEGDAFSYELRGPFALPEDGSAAAADLRYRQIRGTASEEARLFVANGEGWIEIDGERRDLTDEQLAGLVVGEADGGFLEGLDIQEWYVDAETEEAGDGTLTIAGDARAGRTLVGLMGLAGGLGDGTLELDEESEAHIDRLAKTSRLEIVTGADDHLLRRLSYDLDLALDGDGRLRGAFGALDGARVTFDLEVRSPNEPVQISG